jgi:hypothetical protein
VIPTDRDLLIKPNQFSSSRTVHLEQSPSEIALDAAHERGDNRLIETSS